MKPSGEPVHRTPPCCCSSGVKRPSRRYRSVEKPPRHARGEGDLWSGHLASIVVKLSPQRSESPRRYSARIGASTSPRIPHLLGDNDATRVEFPAFHSAGPKHPQSGRVGSEHRKLRWKTQTGQTSDARREIGSRVSDARSLRTQQCALSQCQKTSVVGAILPLRFLWIRWTSQ